MKDGKLSICIRVLIVLCVVTVLVMLGLGVLLMMRPQVEPPGTQASPTPEGLLQAADLAPDPTRWNLSYDLPLLDGAGRSHPLSEMRGEPVLLLFWSSWCGDCKQYLTAGFAEAATAAESAGARLVLVCREGVRGDDYAQAGAQLAAQGVGQDTLMDPGAALFREMGLHSVPTLAVLDSEGVLRYATVDMPTGEEITRLIDYASGGQLTQLEAFLRGLIRQDGSMPSAYGVSAEGITPGRDVLSETQGLLMCYALRMGDQPLFDTVWHAARELLLADGLFAWQRTDDRVSGVNASLDDLRIIDALYAADARWGGYRTDAAKLAHTLYNKTVKQQLMRDFVQLADGQCTLQATLCYQHPAAMRRLAMLDVRWTGAAERAEALLRGGVISDEFPLYWPRYDTAAGAYTGDPLHMTEAMVTVLHAAEAGLAEERTLAWLEETLRQGPIFASYDTRGNVVPGYRYESTAIYALAAQIGTLTGRQELTRLALCRMERLRCFGGVLAGGYGRVSDRTLYAYDVLQALLAWQTVAAK